MSNHKAVVYLTGAAGMIGSNVARKLVELGAKVIGIDNLWRGTSESISDLISGPNFEFRHADISSDRDWYVDMTSESVLIHTADIVAGIDYVFSNEWSVFQKNLLINTQVARIANQYRPARLIYLGTACSYPQHLQRSVEKSKLSEDMKLPADPESGYGWSKLIGEIEFRLAVKNTDAKLTILDLHNVYGWPCVYHGRTSQVIPSLIYKALTSSNGILSVWGDGKQGRAFIHVSDVVEGVVAALGYAGDKTVFMLGPDRCTTIAEVATLIKQHPDVRIDRIEFDPSKPTGDIGRYADSSLAAQELGWKPAVAFDEGLHDLINSISKSIRHSAKTFAARK